MDKIPWTNDVTVLNEDTMNSFQDNINNGKEEKTYRYTLILTSTVSAGTSVTIPCYYKVGAGVLDVYLNGELLILSSDESGTDGHYLEVGTAGETSNTIKTTTDWSLASGDYLKFVVRGEYDATEE